jgi:hypothetical protein
MQQSDMNWRRCREITLSEFLMNLVDRCGFWLISVTCNVLLGEDMETVVLYRRSWLFHIRVCPCAMVAEAEDAFDYTVGP